jgi:formamidopyrimidine-DNA glycosylase
MPELPEVETLVRTLRPALIGKTILASDLRWARTLAEPTPLAFTRRIKGQMVEDVTRRAKYFDIRLTSFDLIIHLRMSGSLLVVLGGYEPENHDRLILKLSDDTSLVFNDPRKFGRAWLVEDPARVFAKLGPEPLSDAFSAEWLHMALHSRRRQLKPLLLDQGFLAGLGNIYVDESLHRAKLHPLKQSDRVTVKQAEGLWLAIRETLQEGISRWVYRGGDFQNQFRVYGRAGQPCPVCGKKIKRLVVSQRGTHFCPKCQK